MKRLVIKATDEHALERKHAEAERRVKEHKRRLKLALTNMEKWQRRVQCYGEALAELRGQKRPKWTKEI